MKGDSFSQTTSILIEIDLQVLLQSMLMRHLNWFFTGSDEDGVLDSLGKSRAVCCALTQRDEPRVFSAFFSNATVSVPHYVASF